MQDGFLRLLRNEYALAFAFGGFYLAAYVRGVVINAEVDWDLTRAGIAALSVVAGAMNSIVFVKVIWAQPGELGVLQNDKLTVLLGVAFSLLITFGSATETLIKLYDTDEPILPPFLEGMLPPPRPDFMD